MTDHNAEQYAAEMTNGPFLSIDDAPTVDGPISSGQHRLLTDRDGRDFILRALDGREADYNVDAIVDVCRRAADGWDFEQIDGKTFWGIVAANETAELRAAWERDREDPAVHAAERLAGRTIIRYVYQTWSDLNQQWTDSGAWPMAATREEADDLVSDGWPTTEKFPRARLVKRTVTVSEVVEIAEGPVWPDNASE